MSGPPRNPDKLNTIGVVVVGICGAVLVYVTIVALEAFYVNDTSDVQKMADYGGQDTTQLNLKTEQVKNLHDNGAPNGVAPGSQQTYRIPIETAMKLVVQDANKPNADLSRLAGTGLPPASKQPAPALAPSPSPSPSPTPPTEAGSAAPPPAPAPGSAAPPAGGNAP